MNIELGSAYKTITWDVVKDLPVFGEDCGLFNVGYKALFVPLLGKREQVLEYAWDNKRAPIIETVKKDDGITTYEFQMFKIVED
jgi:hypothetical protein